MPAPSPGHHQEGQRQQGVADPAPCSEQTGDPLGQTPDRVQRVDQQVGRGRLGIWVRPEAPESEVPGGQRDGRRHKPQQVPTAASRQQELDRGGDHKHHADA